MRNHRVVDRDLPGRTGWFGPRGSGDLGALADRQDVPAGAGTTGVISITPAQQGIEIRSLKDYVGVGTAYFSGAYSDLAATFREIGTGELFKFSALYERRTFDYIGSGLLTASGTTDAPSSFQTPENTVLFTVSGDSQDQLVCHGHHNMTVFVQL